MSKGKRVQWPASDSNIVKKCALCTNQHISTTHAGILSILDNKDSLCENIVAILKDPILTRVVDVGQKRDAGLVGAYSITDDASGNTQAHSWNRDAIKKKSNKILNISHIWRKDSHAAERDIAGRNGPLVGRRYGDDGVALPNIGSITGQKLLVCFFLYCELRIVTRNNGKLQKWKAVNLQTPLRESWFNASSLFLARQCRERSELWTFWTWVG